MTDLEHNTITAVVEAYGLSRVLELLADYCRTRADHGATPRSAWEDMGEELEDLASVAGTFGLA
jgi:hypothetical protein